VDKALVPDFGAHAVLEKREGGAVVAASSEAEAERKKGKRNGYGVHGGVFMGSGMAQYRSRRGK